MESVIISANIENNKKSEFYQVMEPLKRLIKNYCKDFEVTVSEDNNIIIRVVFDKKSDLKENFDNKEFNILKGSIRSLCNNVKIKISDD